MLKASQRLTNRAALSAESFSRIPAELLRLVGDDAAGHSAEPSEAGDHRLRELRLQVEELAVVDDLADHLVHVVGLPRATPARCRAASPTSGRRDRRSRAPAASARSWTGSRRGSASPTSMHSGSSATSRSPTPGLAAVDPARRRGPPSRCPRRSPPWSGAARRAPSPPGRRPSARSRTGRGCRRCRPRRARASPRPVARRRTSRPPRGTGGRSRRTSSRRPPGSGRPPSRAARSSASASAAPSRAGGQP